MTTVDHVTTYEPAPVAELLAELRARELEVCLENGRVRIRGPSRAFTASLRAQVLARRDGIVAELENEGRVAALRLALHEVALLPVRLWVTAAGAHSLVLSLSGRRLPVVVLTTSRRRHEAAPARGEAAFGPLETLALLTAAENHRASSNDLASWSERKLLKPSWTLTPEVALAGLARSPEVISARPTWWDGAGEIPGHWRDLVHGWSLGWLTGSYGARLVDVVIEDEQTSPTTTERAA